jgi:hypothetical protein
MVLLLTALACNLPGVPSTREPPGRTATPTPTAGPAATDTPVPAPPEPTVDDFFARCPTADEISAVDAQLALLFEADPTAGTLVCTAAEGSADLTRLQMRAYQSVIIMQYLEFDAPLPWTAAPLFDWFTGTISAIRFRDDVTYSYCCDPVDTINILVADNSYLVLTDRWIQSDIGGGLQDTMILYVHEARHNEGLGHTCEGGNDQTLAEMGAWAVQYYLDLWLAEHSDRTFLRPSSGDPNGYRSLALANAETIRASRFCSEPTATPGPGPTLSP